MDEAGSSRSSPRLAPLQRLHTLALPSPTAPASSSNPSSSPSSSSASGSSVTHHILPKSVSPRNDLAILFSTVAPASKAAAAAASGAPAPNYAGMSAAQRMIQQRVAMMRARAAAAAGMAASDSATASTDTGPIKGQSIELSLWRLAQGGTDLVWRQPLKVPDTLFSPLKKGREHETVTVLSTEWSPDGRTIAIHFAVCRVPTEEQASKDERALSLLALYAVQDGSLLSLSITSSPKTSSSMPPPGVDMTWVELGMEMSDRSDVPGSSAHAASLSMHAPLDLNPLLALAAPASTGSAASRFQSLMGNQNASSGPSKPTLVLPSQKGLESEHSPSAQDRELQDPLWGWQTLQRDQSRGRKSLDVLLVPTCDQQGSQGVAVLVQGRVRIAFAPLSEGALLSSTLAKEDVLLATLRCAQAASAAEPSLTLEVVRRPLLHLADQASATALYQILDLSSRLRSSMAQILDLDHILVSIYKTLRAPASHVLGSLSVQQMNALPPLSRLQRADHVLSTNHAESLKRHMVATLCTGVYSSMTEVMFLNALAENKWRPIFEETVRIYEAVEVLASEISKILEDAGRMIKELRGWADWPEQSSTILPQIIEIEGRAPVPLLQHLVQVAQSISELKSTVHQVLQYAQGERLAWHEMHKWIRWEHERLEFLRSDQEQLTVPKAFDPVLIVDFVQRDYESFELDWLLLHERKVGVGAAAAANPAGAMGDDTEESFVVFEEKQPKEAQNEGASHSQGELRASTSRRQSNGIAKSRTAPAARVPLRERMQATLQWLREEAEAPQPGEDLAPSSGTGYEHQGLTQPSAPLQRGNDRPALFQPGPATAVAQSAPAIYDVAHPVTDQLLDLVRDIKAVFVGALPYVAGDTYSNVLWSTSLPLQPGRGAGEGSDAAGTDSSSGDDNDEPDSVTSWASRETESAWSPRLPSATTQMDPTVRARMLALQRCAHNEIILRPSSPLAGSQSSDPAGTLQHYQLVVGDRHRGRVLCLRIPLPRDVSIPDASGMMATELDPGCRFERIHTMPGGKQLVVFKTPTQASEGAPAAPEVSTCDLDEVLERASGDGAGRLQRLSLQFDPAQREDSMLDVISGEDETYIATSNSIPLAARLVRQRSDAAAGEDERRPGSKFGGWVQQRLEFWR